MPLDDKQLVDQFELRVIRQPDPVAAVQRFIYGLLKSKYLFDQFIIKREFADGKDSWSLKRLHWYSERASVTSIPLTRMKMRMVSLVLTGGS
nr:hypothetical protein [Klebsiella pneumoniae subsp. pneumoniae]